jgi:hypothetical protein
MSQNTGNTTAFIEAEQYSKFILANLPDQLLPESFARDVSDFASGTTLNIKSVGSATLQDLEEDTEPTFNAIDTSTVTLTITDWKGDAWFVSDKLREDGSQVEQLGAMRAMEATRAIAEARETDYFIAAEAGQRVATTATALGLINGRPHEWVAGGSGGTNRHMTLSDFIGMKLSFDKANSPQAGRVAIVDPIVEATLNGLTNIVNVSNNPMFEGMVTTGFASNHKFIRNIFGWDIYTSNFLPTEGTALTLNASAYGLANDDTVAGDKASIFMCVLDDSCKPMMTATRRQPKTVGWRDDPLEQDKFKVSTRYGYGTQRYDTLGVIWVDALTY